METGNAPARTANVRVLPLRCPSMAPLEKIHVTPSLTFQRHPRVSRMSKESLATMDGHSDDYVSFFERVKATARNHQNGVGGFSGAKQNASERPERLTDKFLRNAY